MKKIKGILLFGCLVTPLPLLGMKLIPSNSSTYYRIGGASDLLIPPVSSVKRIKLGANINGSLMPSCSSFNPTITLKNSLNNINDSFNGLPSDIIVGLTAAVQGFALAKIQQTMPDTFDLLQNQSLFAGNEFQLKQASCFQIQNQVANGQSPLDGLFELSDSQGWIDASLRAIRGTDVDVVKEEKKITQHREEYGVPWIHRNTTYSGGKNQVPIKVISDVVIAGYNLIAYDGKKVILDSIQGPPANSPANFVRFWPNPKVAATWATKVLGDVSFSKDKKSSDASHIQVGVGLAAMLQSCPEIGKSANTCPEAVASYIWEIIDGKRPLNATNLEALNSGGMAVSFEVMDAIMHLPRVDQVVVVSKLAEDLAIQNLIEEAIALRRILHAGFQIQEVQNLKPIRETIKDTIALLDKEIESLAFENKIRKALTTKTMTTLLEIRGEALAESDTKSQVSSEHVNNGAIYDQKGEGQ